MQTELKEVERYKMAFYNVQVLNVNETRKQQHFSGNQRYTYTHTKTMYDNCVHSSLPKSAILALGLLKKKEENDQQFCVGSDNAFQILWNLTIKCILVVLKVATNVDTTVENAYTVKSA